MKYDVNPLVDCVFKAIFGQEQNKNLLLDFLNAVLDTQQTSTITHVDLINPYNDKQAMDGKVTIVDVKARDQLGRYFQIEVQVASDSYLPQRLLYTHCQLIADQLEEGQRFKDLKPTISIWIFKDRLFKNTEHYHHCFKAHDGIHDLTLCEDMSIHVFELGKWNRLGIEKSLDMWLKFLRDGQKLDDEKLPAKMNNPLIKQALSTMKRFSDDETARDIYRRRINYLRIQKDREMDMQELQADMEELQADMEHLQTHLEQIQSRADSEAAKSEKMRQKLLEMGVNPDQLD